MDLAVLAGDIMCPLSTHSACGTQMLLDQQPTKDDRRESGIMASLMSFSRFCSSLLEDSCIGRAQPWQGLQHRARLVVCWRCWHCFGRVSQGLRQALLSQCWRGSPAASSGKPCKQCGLLLESGPCPLQGGI